MPGISSEEVRRILDSPVRPLGESPGEILEAPSRHEAEPAPYTVGIDIGAGVNGAELPSYRSTFSERNGIQPAPPEGDPASAGRPFSAEDREELIHAVRTLVSDGSISPEEGAQVVRELDCEDPTGSSGCTISERVRERVEEERRLAGRQVGSHHPAEYAGTPAFDPEAEARRISQMANATNDYDPSVRSVTLPGGWELCMDATILRCEELERRLSPEYIPGESSAPRYVTMTADGRRFRAYYATLWAALISEYRQGALTIDTVKDILKAAVRAELRHNTPVEANIVRDIIQNGRESRNRARAADRWGARSAENERVPDPEPPLGDAECCDDSATTDDPAATTPSPVRRERTDRQDYSSKYRHLFSDKVLRVFKEEGIADEEAIRVLSRMFARGEVSTSVLMDGSYIFKYCDDRRYLMNKILNRVAADRASIPIPPPPEFEAEGNDFDPTIDMLTGRPVGL